MLLMAREGKICAFMVVAGLICMLCGCDPLTRYKVAATVFDGVPRMPPADQYCQEYHEQATVQEREAEARKKLEQKDTESVHPPYAEKRCDACHDKNTESGFVVARDKLCGVCHQNFIKGAFGHGPAVVGACLSCHVPHNSKFPKLLKVSKEELCKTCHHEERLSKGMHDKVSSKNIACTDCHDPHSGNRKYFLK
jgi:predicted CXXCH cytochrome family protein